MLFPRLNADPWLGEMLHCDAFRLTLSPQSSLAATNLPRPTEMVKDRRVFIYAKTEPSALEESKFLESHGFHLLDTNLTFSKKVNTFTTHHDTRIRLANQTDSTAVIALASSCFKMDRFHRDPEIAFGIADKLKGAWVENYFSGKRGEAMVVAEQAQKIVGFLLLLRLEQTLIIDLVGVLDDSRKLGLAGAMCRFSENLFPDVKKIMVGTQAVNSGSIIFYQKNGFKLDKITNIYHFHGALPRFTNASKSIDNDKGAE